MGLGWRWGSCGEWVSGVGLLFVVMRQMVWGLGSSGGGFGVLWMLGGVWGLDGVKVGLGLEWGRGGVWI